MWVYEVKTGRLTHTTEQGVRIAGTGYSGKGKGLNNCDCESIHEVGPLPRGLYTIGDFSDHPRLGKFAAALSPDPSNKMYGRSEFYIHGDNLSHDNSASEGCIILPRVIRDQIARSGDKELQVI